ncbi:ester cyclase [uncultured Devosia sp.]|uniref:nuclear transport factor 2 family protein n=1 Tax=uncultured Devosia sp. TaxID=211434 RepID=UPI0035CB508C
MISTADSIVENKRLVIEAIGAIAGGGLEGLEEHLTAAYHPDAKWRGSHPLNEMDGRPAIETRVWRPLLTAMPDLERRDLMVAAGRYQDHDLVATLGHYAGVFRRDWLGIPATGRPVFLRSGEVHRIEDGRIVQSSVLFDILDLMRQAGFRPIAPSLGREHQWPGPIGPGAICLDPVDLQLGAASLAQTLAMHGGIHGYAHDADNPRQSYLASTQQQFWHRKMMWYGPSGIGTARGWQNYVDFHAVPWISAFPDRHGVGHYVRLGDGPVSVTGGWPSVEATHSGGSIFGMAPTGRTVRVRVMDFYYHHDGIIRENWVPMDIIDLLGQMGIDVFERMQSFFQRGRYPD